MQIQIKPPFYNEEFDSYKKSDLDLNKFFVGIKLQIEWVEGGITKLNNIKMEVYLNGEKIHVYLNDKWGLYDNNSDGLIDVLSRAESMYILASTDSPVENFDNYELEVRITSIDGVATNIIQKETLSYYKVADFEMLKDSYSFENLPPMSFNEFIDVCSGIDIITENPIAALFYLAGTWNGRCFGMAATAGAYYLNDNKKPIAGEIHDWDLDKLNTQNKLNILENITRYHLTQGRYKPQYELDVSYANLLDGIQSSNPVVIGIESVDEKMHHAILCYSITEFSQLNLSAIQVYENEFPDEGWQCLYYKSNQIFDYTIKNAITFDKFYSFPQSAYNTPNLSTAINSYQDDLISDLFNTFKIFSTACPVNLCVKNEEGGMCGFLDDGTIVNTISGSEIKRIPTGNFEGDSITLIYVPFENNYSCEINSFQEGNLRFEYYSPLDENSVFTALADSIEISSSSTLTFNDTIPSTIQLDKDGDDVFEASVATIQNPIIYVHTKVLENSNVKIYPNPAKENVYIKFEKDVTNKAQINIYNISGQRVFVTREITGNVFEWNRTNNAGDVLNNGIYIIELIVNDQKIVEKIILE